MRIKRVLIWGPLLLGLLACMPEGLFDSGVSGDSVGGSTSTDGEDCSGYSTTFTSPGGQCNPAVYLPICGSDDSAGYPTVYHCNRDTCTWDYNKTCEGSEGEGPDCFGCGSGQCTVVIGCQ